MQNLTDFDLEVISEYERVLTGNLRCIDTYYLTRSPDANSRTALMLIQYLSENYLHWSPLKLYESLDIKLLTEWRLASVIKLINFPPELNPRKNVNYVAHLIYPHQVPLSDKDISVMVYEQLLNDEIKRFPKKFFLTSRGMHRICVCLKYAIDHYTNFKTVDEMYDFFGTGQSTPFLRNYRLSPHIKDLFDTPITAVHILTPEEQRNHFLFQYYRFQQLYEEHIAPEETRGAKPIYYHADLSKEEQRHVQAKF